MSGAVKILPHYTYRDYTQWEGKWELIEGIPHAMSPAPAPIHQIIANNLGALFFNALSERKKCKAAQAIDFKIAEDTVVQPDLSILCQPITQKFIDFSPALVVEILTPSTALKDRYTKMSLYSGQRIPYYLIVAPETEEVEVYILENTAYTLVQKGRDFQYNFLLAEDCHAHISFGRLWA